MNKTKQCQQCLFYNAKDDFEGTCRLHPPTVSACDGRLCSSWPTVKARDVCGDFATLNTLSEGGAT